MDVTNESRERTRLWIPIGVGQQTNCDVCNTKLWPNDRVEVLNLTDSADVLVVATRDLNRARTEIGVDGRSEVNPEGATSDVVVRTLLYFRSLTLIQR